MKQVTIQLTEIEVLNLVGSTATGTVVDVGLPDGYIAVVYKNVDYRKEVMWRISEAVTGCLIFEERTRKKCIEGARVQVTSEYKDFLLSRLKERRRQAVMYRYVLWQKAKTKKGD